VGAVKDIITIIKEVLKEMTRRLGKKERPEGRIEKLLHVYGLKFIKRPRISDNWNENRPRIYSVMLMALLWHNTSLPSSAHLLSRCKELRYRRRLVEGQAPMSNILINLNEDR
jgi:hypothetical protein